jgi:hypothetical protein
MQTDSYPADVVEHLRVFSRDDDVARQQYLDFLKLRNFRQSLLCHSEVRLHRQPDPQPVVRMSAVCEARAAAPEMDVRSDEAQQFQHPKGQKITTNHPLAKAAILHAGRLWPHAVRFPDLLEAARARTGRAASSVPLDEDSNWLSGMLLRLFAANFVELHLCPPVFAGHASDRPLVSALARAQAQCGSTVTNLRHASVEIEDEAARQLLFLLDGTRDRPQLLAELRKRAHPGEITEEQLETNLARLVRLALLVA